MFKINYQPYDYSVAELFKKWQADTLILEQVAPSRILRSNYVEALLLGFPTNPFHMTEQVGMSAEHYTLTVLDGNARLTKLFNVLRDREPICEHSLVGDYKNIVYFSDLPKTKQDLILKRSMRCLVLLGNYDEEALAIVKHQLNSKF